MKKSSLLLLLGLLTAFTTLAQPRMSPKDMVMREKQNLYSKVDDLSEDQKEIIDGVYEEYAVSIEENFEEIRRTRNWDEMHEKMEALRAEKDGLMYDVLSEEQYAIYAELTESQRKEMEERRKNGPGPGDRPAPPNQ